MGLQIHGTNHECIYFHFVCIVMHVPRLLVEHITNRFTAWSMKFYTSCAFASFCHFPDKLKAGLRDTLLQVTGDSPAVKSRLIYYKDELHVLPNSFKSLFKYKEPFSKRIAIDFAKSPFRKVRDNRIGLFSINKIICVQYHFHVIYYTRLKWALKLPWIIAGAAIFPETSLNRFLNVKIFGLKSLSFAFKGGKGFSNFRFFAL